MAESGSHQDRTEAPTPKRRREARERGQVARSREVSTAVLLLAGAGLLEVAGAGLAVSMRDLFAESVRAVGAPPQPAAVWTEWLRDLGWRTLGALAPFLGLMAAAAVGVNAIQARGVLSFKVLEPKWSRISPVRNAKRLLGVRQIAELGKSILKLAVLATAVYVVARAAWPTLTGLSQASPAALLAVAHEYSVRVLLVAGLAYLAVAVADYGYQVWQHERNLRMSREEVKREQKDTEGDLMVKARMRSMGRSLARRRMFLDVPSADVVLTNPTQLAVALRYDPLTAPAPMIVAMGQRKIAERIRALAHEAGVPIIENRPLARALFAAGRVGAMIPPELYVAVAEVLAFVYRHGWKRPGRRPGLEIVAGGEA